MRVPLVVVVDDDASVRRALTRLLLSADLRVLTYASATEFLDSGIGSAPDCVILDIHLGGMSGLERLARLRESGHGLPIFHARDTPYPRWGLRAGRKKGEFDASPPRPLGSTKRGRVPDRRAARQSKSYHCVHDHTIRTGGLGHGRTGTQQ
jgi:CheY-like chemotaxis protein